jgi:hypothetical protein
MKVLGIIFAASSIFLLLNAEKYLESAFIQADIQATYPYVGPGAAMLIVGILLGVYAALIFLNEIEEYLSN